jgi:hypothetical protein
MFHENPQLAGRARRRIEDEARGALGIRNPERDYEKSFRELDEAKRSSDEAFHRRRELAPIDEDEYQRRRNEVRRGHTREATEKEFRDRLEEMDRLRGPARDDSQRREREAEARQHVDEDAIRRDLQQLDRARASTPEEYQRRQRALESLRPDISDEEYQRRRKELRKQTAEQLTPEARDVSPAAAMQVGSREAYSTLVQGILGNQKEQLQREANAKLDRIEQAIRERNGQQVEVLE